jgi:hypothetical protein
MNASRMSRAGSPAGALRSVTGVARESGPVRQSTHLPVSQPGERDIWRSEEPCTPGSRQITPPDEHFEKVASE